MKTRNIPAIIINLLMVAVLFGGCTGLHPAPKEALRIDDVAEPSAFQQPIFFTVGPGDELQITVWNIPELNQTITVDPNGQISIPMAGIATVTGKSISEVTQVVRQGLDQYYINPEVSVSVKTLRSNKMSVLGEVTNPGVFAMDGETRLLDALAMAGDFTDDAEPKSVALIRGNLDSPQVYLLDVKRLIGDGDLKQNVALQKGDIVYVPQSFISSVDSFFLHFYRIIGPIVEMERGVVLIPAMGDAFDNKNNIIQIVR